jgi:ferrous iron transport protein B
VFYQTMTYAQHPDSSLAWSGGLIGAFALILLALRVYGSRQQLGAGR